MTALIPSCSMTLSSPCGLRFAHTHISVNLLARQHGTNHCDCPNSEPHPVAVVLNEITRRARVDLGAGRPWRRIRARAELRASEGRDQLGASRYTLLRKLGWRSASTHRPWRRWHFGLHIGLLSPL